jgi:hypothetical protein
MITEQDLREAIAECEGQRNPNASTCMKLAAFYTIRNEMFPDGGTGRDAPRHSFAAGPPEDGGSAFLEAARGKDVTAVMDELMSTLEVIQPRLYDGVMRKIRELA